MFILDEEKLNQYLEGIAKGFEHNPFEIIMTVLFIIFCFTLLIFIINVYQKKKRKKSRSLAEIRFGKMLEKMNLSESDTSIITMLTHYFPKSPEYICELLTDHVLFQKSAKPLIDNGILTNTSLVLLKKRLGFLHNKKIVTYHSTAELSGGTALLLFYKGIEYRGTITCITEDDIQIVSMAPVTIGEQLLVHFFMQTGYYSFYSLVREKKENRITLSHSESITRIQNRAFFRAPVRIQAYIKTLTVAEPRYQTTILDLSGSGALLTNPDKRFQKMDECYLAFSLPGKTQVYEKTQVVRLSPDITEMSVRFVCIKENIRDKLIKYVMNS